MRLSCLRGGVHDTLAPRFGNVVTMDITLRPATLEDAAALREVLGSDPSEEQLGLAGGDPRRAIAFRALMNARLTAPDLLACTTVAVQQGTVVGMLQTGAEVGDAITMPVVLGVIRIFGLGLPAFLRRDAIRSRVAIAAPAGAYHIAELHVATAHRNGGIGRVLLAEAERAAHRAGARTMSLTTATNNPARRLYERFGFEVAQVRTDPAYEALTKVSGRVLMIKTIVPGEARH
jgi:ribosomal protein S18 acetylase RimI-like enzyme